VQLRKKFTQLTGRGYTSQQLRHTTEETGPTTDAEEEGHSTEERGHGTKGEATQRREDRQLRNQATNWE
jgi:hypothetical protein